MTALHDTTARHLGPIDLSAVASESSAESIAHENEIVEHIAHEHDFPEQPSEHPIEEQLGGLVPADRLRAEGDVATRWR